VAISQEQACEAVQSHLRGQSVGGEPELEFRAAPVRETPMWAVRAYAVEPGPGVVGPTYLVGPDRKVWTFSGDPQVHDLGVAIDALVRVYAEQLAGQVDPGLLAERVRELSAQRRALLDAVVSDARAGVLKVQRRALP
jgi:hypothetical protein